MDDHGSIQYMKNKNYKKAYRLTTIFHRLTIITILSLYQFSTECLEKIPRFFRKIPPSGSSRTSWNLGHDVLGPIKGRIRNGCIREFSNPEKSRFRMRSKHLFPNQKNRVKRIVKQGTSIWWKWTNNDPYHQLISHAKLPTLHVWGPFSPSFNSNN